MLRQIDVLNVQQALAENGHRPVAHDGRAGGGQHICQEGERPRSQNHDVRVVVRLQQLDLRWAGSTGSAAAPQILKCNMAMVKLAHQDWDRLLNGEDAERIFHGYGQQLAELPQRVELQDLIILPQLR